MPKRPMSYGGPLGSGVKGGKTSATGLGKNPQGNDNQQTRYPKRGGKNSRPSSKK